MSGSAAMTPSRILVVEDLDHNRELFRTVLARAGYAVETAPHGQAALAALQAGAFDLVLMDVQMPVLDGLAATRAIRKLDGPARDVTIVGMSANVLPDQLRAFEAAGMDDHLGKPFRRAQLLEKVGAWLERSGGPAGDPLPALAVGPETDRDPGAVEPLPVQAGDAAADGGRRAADPPLCLARDAVAGGDPRAAVSADLEDLVGLMGRDWLLTGLGKLIERIDETFAGEAVTDPPLVARQAHALVSQAALVGFRGFADACSTLEEACLRGREVGAAYALARTTAAAVRREAEGLQARYSGPVG